MTRVLCFGDSNTWGFDPASGERYGAEVRWTGVLARTLGSGFTVIEEGLNGRTTVFDDPFEGVHGWARNGLRYLLPCLQSQRPLELVLLMLGTNDLKSRFGLTAFDIADGVRVLAELILASEAGPGGRAPALLLLAPPPLAAENLGERFAGGLPKSRELARHYRAVADELGCAFFDVGSVIASSRLDGVHFDPDAHLALGRALAARVRELLG